ncbi:MAG: hypothetical protein AABX70_04435 [Nanoarchaeota archaeon]
MDSPLKPTPIILPRGIKVDAFDGPVPFYAHLTPPANVTPQDISRTLKGWFGDPKHEFFRTGEAMVYGSNTPELFAAIWASREIFKGILTKEDTKESIIAKLGINPRKPDDVYLNPSKGIGSLLYSVDWTFQLLDGTYRVVPQEYTAFMQCFDWGLDSGGMSVESSALRVMDREPLFKIFKECTGLDYLADPSG